MEKTEGTQKSAPRLSDEAVKAKTGKTLAEWFAILDKAGAKKMNHTEIAAHLYERLKVPGWWNQMVAVTYEQARGMREKHQRPTGYEISVSKTVSVNAAVAYKAWKDEMTRSRWLPKTPIVIHRATAGKSMRITWIDGKKSVDVNFYPKGSTKSQIVVQHGKLSDAKTAARMKTYWAKTLDRLKEILEV